MRDKVKDNEVVDGKGSCTWYRGMATNGSDASRTCGGPCFPLSIVAVAMKWFLAVMM